MLGHVGAVDSKVSGGSRRTKGLRVDYFLWSHKTSSFNSQLDQILASLLNVSEAALQSVTVEFETLNVVQAYVACISSSSSRKSLYLANQTA
jgi:hypothetical protein